MTVISSPIFTEAILPFLFIFVVVFAILQKSKILEGKAQIDAMVALAIGLISISFEQPRTIVVGLMPWLAVGIAVIFVFLVLYGFVAGDQTSAPKWMKIVFGILSGIFVIGVVISVTGIWKEFKTWAISDGWWGDLLMLLVFGVAVGVVIGAGKDSSDDGKKKEKKE